MRREFTRATRAASSVICGGCGLLFSKPYRMSATRLAADHFCSAECSRRYRSRVAAENVEARFWSYILQPNDPNCCWPWQGQVDANGYGRFNWRRGETQLAHRLSYRLAHGELPVDRFVCHRCDNPPCINPAHLFLGTQLDNMRDAAAKGRTASPDRRGEEVNTAKLSTTDVVFIRGATATTAEVAALFDISQAQVNNIRKRRQWKHVP